MEKETTKPFHYANPSSIDVELKCVVCHEPFTEPVMLRCCELFLCRQCVGGDGEVCPLCAENPLPFSKPQKPFLNMLARIEVGCNTCGAIVKRDVFPSHQHDKCVIDCPNKCGVPLTRAGLASHLAVCVNEVVRCAASDVGCKHETRRGVMGEHEQACLLLQQRPLLLRIRELESKVESLEKEKRQSDLETALKIRGNETKMKLLEQQTRQFESETRRNEQVQEQKSTAMESRLKLLEIEERNRRGRKKIKLIGTKFEAFPVDGTLGCTCALDGNILAADWNNKVIQVLCLSPKGELIRSFGSQGSDKVGSLSFPRCVCVLDDGTIAVSDYWSHRIVIFSPTGEFIQTIDKGRGCSNCKVSFPAGLCALGGNLVIADYGNNRIQIVSPTGEFIRAFGSKGNAEGSFSGPMGICVLDGNIVVTDHYNHRTQIFSGTGEFIRAFGSEGKEEGEFNCPYGICVLDGCIVVADTGNHRIQFFSATGEFIRAYGSYGSEGKGNGCFCYPQGVCVVDGRLVVTEEGRIVFLS